MQDQQHTHIGQKLKAHMDANQIKVAEVAAVFGVKSPSVYDWINFGRMDKKHYATLVKWSGNPIEYWLNIPHQIQRQENPFMVQEEQPIYMTPRLRTLIELFQSVTRSDQEEVINALQEKQRHHTNRPHHRRAGRARGRAVEG
jgi:predicted XRE-type DNA-binding protein